jgi:2-amino-4-hydroxy-6-hydroxymethyldihydropteridine diphosphokinase
MTRCLLALGSNLGDRPENLSRATGEVASLPGTRLLARSKWHETTPIGGPSGQGAFLNGSLLLDTRLSPVELSHALHDIEQSLGRRRVVRWDARVIDIDVLLYDRQQFDSAGLIIPHPRMSFRRFVLEPACEIAGLMVDPTSGWTLARLLRHLDESPRYVAVTAVQPESARRLAGGICQALGSFQLESLLPLAASGPDSPTAKTVEFTSAIHESIWLQIPELAARLPGTAESTLPPVVSGFWCDAVPSGLVRPALVIAWEIPHSAAAQDELREKLDRPGHGPLARIKGEDFPAVLSEAIAAVRAVWPRLPTCGAK